MSFLGKENFFIEIIENCPNELLNERERYWIKFYNSYNDGFLWSFNNIFPQNAKCNNQKKVAQYDLQGNLLQIYSSRAEASRQTGIDSSSIAKCCNKKQKTCKGYIWRNLE